MANFIGGKYVKDKEVEDLAEYGSIPIINGLTDFCHPCQVLADLMTIREFKGSFDGLKMCFIGDGNNMANSLIVGCLKVGMSVAIACPDDYQPPKEILDFAKGYGDKFEMTNSPQREQFRSTCKTGCKGRRCAHHRRMGFHGSGGRSREAQKGFRRLSDQRRPHDKGKCGCDSSSLSPCTPRGGDHREGIRGSRRRDI